MFKSRVLFPAMLVLNIVGIEYWAVRVWSIVSRYTPLLGNITVEQKNRGLCGRERFIN